MAETETTVPMDDKELFAAAMAPEPVEEASPSPAETPEAVADETGRLHGKDGKFISKAETTDAAPIQQQATETSKPIEPAIEAKDEQANVPSWRLRELREERDALAKRAEEIERSDYSTRQQMQALQRELADLKKPKQEPIDVFADPEAAFKQRLAPIEERFQTLSSTLMLRASRAENVASHGKDIVAETEKAIEAAMRSNHPEMPSLAQRMRQSDDPVGEAVQWYQRDKLHKETGGDLNAFKQKLLDDAVKDPAFQAKVLEAARGQAQNGVNNGSRPSPVQLPPSLNRAPGSGITAAELTEADGSDAGLFRHATQGMRR